MRTTTTLCLVAVLGLATTSNAAEIGRAISPLGDLNVVFNIDADGDGLPNYDADIVMDGFDDGDTIPEHFDFNGRVGGDMFGLGRRPADRSDADYYPFPLIDDSLAFFPTDTIGIITSGDDGLQSGNIVPPDTDPFFGVVDVNSTVTVGEPPDTMTIIVNDQPQAASWTFDISSAEGGLSISIDMAAMGDFEAGGANADSFLFEFAIDGGSFATLFEPLVDEDDMFTYTLESGATNDLNDPLKLDGVTISNMFQTFTAPVVGSGISLELRFTAFGDGGSEAFAFRNISLNDGGIVVPTDNADFNGDGVVDAADYTVWRDNEGTMGGAMTNTGDTNGDGNVDATDYGIWRSMFGDTVPGSLSVEGGAVPEPSTLVGISLALALGLFTRKRWS